MTLDKFIHSFRGHALQVWHWDMVATLTTRSLQARRLVKETKMLITDIILQIVLGAMRGKKGQAQETS